MLRIRSYLTRPQVNSGVGEPLASRHATMDIAIHDLESGGLAFDLAELVDVIGPRAGNVWWRVRGPVSYLADADIAALEVPGSETGPWLPGSTFLPQVQLLRQVIDGVFESAFDGPSGPEGHWVTLRAVDSSWWEVYTEDPEVLARVHEHFRDVRPARYTASTVY